ncbi:MAG: type IV toxin-antitoxin system AbiEi family antitoxin [Oceanicaulis sp.]|nr:type IV toxin-antitoxin system AbiEi family antitoxin [Oceanicaulis sp.]
MSGERGRKIKSVLDAVPPGALVDSKWLNRHHVADSLYHDYAKRGWLIRLARGVFIRPDSTFDADQPLSWQAVTASMSMIMEMPFHVGGMTALGLHGYGHYAQLSGDARVTLYAEQLPGWLSRIKVDARFEERSLKLFADPVLGVEPLNNPGFRFGGEAAFPVSNPERAILEALDELPDGAGFDQLDKVCQGLAGLSPRKLMALLTDCRKVKVVRLFFVFADRHGRAWLKHLDKSKLDFGKGDRQLVKGGKIHPAYRITVPAKFVTSGQESDHA